MGADDLARGLGTDPRRGKAMTAAIVRSIPLDWSPPAAPYVPGATPRHREEEPLFAIAEAAPTETRPDAWADNAAWLGGLELFARGYFWEAHELWEPVWMHARPNSRERTLVRGLIQCANACLKMRMDRPGAARRLLDVACECLTDASRGPTGTDACLLGLDVRATTDATLAFRDHVAAAETITDALVARPDYRQFLHYNA